MPRKPPVKWSNDELVAKARQARVFEEPIVQEFLDRTEEQLFDRWKTTKDSVEREELYLQCQGLSAFRKFIEETVVLGNMAQAELNQKFERESNR